jgi:riboflavin kinase / FMN adenylyltransferase
MSGPAVFHRLEEAAQLLPRRPLHLAIGMFDGVHLGHRAVVETAVQSAQRDGGVAVALTFDPHPSRLLRPDDPVRLLQSPELRARHLRAAGVAAVVIQPFTRAFSQLEAEGFLPFIRERLPQLGTVYVGENWRFGRGRRGDVTLLNEEARRLGLAVVSAPRINHNGEPISSTRIRTCVENGDIQLANTLLGYTYTTAGVVTAGKRLGRSLGFPTLNLPWTPECRPRMGVYVVRVGRPGERIERPAVANYGLRPTVDEAVAPRLEVHLLAECPYDEGDRLEVEWEDFLRPEQRFGGLEALRTQIARDVEMARAWHAARGT